MKPAVAKKTPDNIARMTPAQGITRNFLTILVDRSLFSDAAAAEDALSVLSSFKLTSVNIVEMGDVACNDDDGIVIGVELELLADMFA